MTTTTAAGDESRRLFQPSTPPVLSLDAASNQSSPNTINEVKLTLGAFLPAASPAASAASPEIFFDFDDSPSPFAFATNLAAFMAFFEVASPDSSDSC